MATPKHYETFVAVCEERNLARAAKRLHCSPSSVSKQLTALEQNLGAVLLDRTTRVVAVTPAGQRFYHRCKEVLALIDEAEQEVRETQGDVAGNIVLSLPKVLLHSDLISILARFCQLYPNVKMDVRVSNEYENLTDQQIDFALRIGELPDSRLHAVTLKKLKPIFCASPAYLQRCGTPRNLGELLEHEVLISTALNLSHAQRGLADELDGFSLDLDQHHTFDDATALLTAMRCGMGIGVLISDAPHNDLQSGRLVQLLPKQQLGEKPLQLVFKKRDRQPERLTLFKTHLLEAYRAL